MLWKSSKVICLHVTLVIWHIAEAFDVKESPGRPVYSNSNRSAYKSYPTGIFHNKAVGFTGINFCPSCHLSFHHSTITYFQMITSLYPTHNEVVGDILVSLRLSIWPSVHPASCVCSVAPTILIGLSYTVLVSVVQSGGVVTRSNLSQINTQHCTDSSRTQYILEKHNRHPFLALGSEIWVVCCVNLKKIGCVMAVPHCFNPFPVAFGALFWVPFSYDVTSVLMQSSLRTSESVVLCLYVLLCLVVTKKCKYGEIKLCGKKKFIGSISHLYILSSNLRRCVMVKFFAKVAFLTFFLNL